MTKLFKFLKQNILLIFIVAVAFVLRVENLGYSDYQGDEIKAFFRPSEDQTARQFLLDQRKGPGQFFVTYLVELVNPQFLNEFITRIPFALAGVLAVFFFYKFVNLFFNKKIAFYASFFFATNGFFVALSRIAQYQAFVILFMILALYFFSLALHHNKFKKTGIFFGFIFWALSMLFHYDGIFIAPFALSLVIIWFFREFKLNKKTTIAVLLFSLLISGLLLASFYVPFVSNIKNSTLSYWEGRISGNVSTKLSSSKYLFTVYQPIYVIHFYFLLAFFGFSAYFFALEKKFLKLKFLNFLPSFNFSLKNTFFVFLWFLVPFIFMEVFVSIPGTHIYAYLLPVTIILALGIDFIEKILHLFKKIFVPQALAYFGIVVLFTFIFLQSYAIYVENKREYPWESEKFLIWEMYPPTPIYHLSMFGFPYYRNWEGIANAILSSDNNGFYSTNERESIARYYIPFNKGTDRAGHFIYIVNPQSFTNDIQTEKAVYWSERYHPVFTYSRSGKDLVRVYYMKEGSIDEIIKQGY